MGYGHDDGDVGDPLMVIDSDVDPLIEVWRVWG